MKTKALSIPKTAAPTVTNIRILDEELTSVIAGHPGAIDLWTFYEVLDAYLGPWGNNGYPIAYGKRYCQRFTANNSLQDNAIARAWVWKTTIALQEELKAFVMARFQQGTLNAVTESVLRQYAFDSHPRAYTKGGLTLVVLLAPELLPEIASIPKAEFSPLSPNFSDSLRQVFVTTGMVSPRIVGVSLAAMTGPAHNGVFAMAARSDSQRVLNEIRLSDYLGNVKRLIEQGQLDDLLVLQVLTEKLNRTEFPDEGFVKLAREVTASANTRKCAVMAKYPGNPAQLPPAQLLRQVAMCGKL